MSIRVQAGDTVYSLKLELLGQGETARVFPGYLSGQEPERAEWAIKVAKGHQYNLYIEREYETLTRLYHTMLSWPEMTQPLHPPALVDATSNSARQIPLPRVQLGTLLDGRKALIMQPLLRQSLLAAFEGVTEPLAREKLVLRAAGQYASLLTGLAQVDFSCLDRKLGDLWWVGAPESGHLVVTDWNIVRKPFNHVLDMRRFGLLWFELVIGRQMPRDFQPRRQDFEQIRAKVSYGLWYVIGRALGSSMGPQFQPIQELADILAELIHFYQQPLPELIQQGRANLKKAQSHLDRAKADQALIQFDLAHRLGGPGLAADIERAYLWARDPVAQAAPGLLRKLASPQFSEAQGQLQELKQKAHRPQELGDIERLRFGFAILNAAKDVLIKARALTGLAEVARTFAEIQELLVQGVLLPLINKDGLTAQKHFQQLARLLPEGLGAEGLDKLRSLELEALFWVAYQKVQQNLYPQPSPAWQTLENLRETRELITHWPPAYEPNLENLNQLQTIIEANLRAATLNGEAEAAPLTAQTTPDAPPQKPITAAEANNFWLALGEDLVKNRWAESIAELLAGLELAPEREGLKAAVEKIVAQLRQRYQDLSQTSLRPGQLAEQASILEALWQIPPDLSPDLPHRQQLQRDLVEIRNLEAQIAADQRALFQNPGPVLARAFAAGYELFDDPGLAVAALKTVYEAGRWDNDRFNQEIAQLEEQAEQFLTMTQVLAERKQTLEQTMAFYASWLAKTAPAETTTFIRNALQLYLGTAQAQWQAGEEASKSLTRAKHLLESAAHVLEPVDYATYQNLYQHLVELSQNNAAPIPSTVTEAQLEAWFRAYQFEECYKNLAGLQNEVQQQKWLTRLGDANRLKHFLAQGEPELEKTYFRRKQNVQVYTEALDTLYQSAARAEPMAYDLYKDEIQNLYERIWQKLAKLDKKLSREFAPGLQGIG